MMEKPARHGSLTYWRACALAACTLAACGGSEAGVDATSSDQDGQSQRDAPPATPDAATGVGEPTSLTGITLFHNQARLAEGVGLPQLTWDPALATIAANWGAQCIDGNRDGLVDHNANRSETYATYVGENIYGSGGGATARGAVDLWMSEKANYDYASNTCPGGNKVCGHYTQIVWRDTVKLGCALADCPSLRFGSAIICNYGPGGNVGGAKPY